jgi:hypothetical protein
LNRTVIAAFAAAIALCCARPAIASDPGHIDAYVTPYYDSTGPAIHVGSYSSGLGSAKREIFVATILRMKKEWGALGFPQLYVAAIQLFDRGYRNEATYWFYTAQYRGRQFGLLADQKKLGDMGAPGFELYHGQDAFFQLVGPSINGYAFGHTEMLAGIIRRVQSENQTVGDLRSVYPGVNFIAKSKWPAANAELNAGLGKVEASLNGQKDAIAQQRAQNGAAARYGSLTSTRFPGGF